MPVLLLGLAPIVHAGKDWSVPEVRLVKPAKGLSQKVKTSRRNYKDEAGHRTLETLVKADLDSGGAQARHSILKKRIYDEGRLVTFYRKMESRYTKGRRDWFQLRERTQISKNSQGDFRSTLIREYFIGGDQAPAVRLMLNFEPYLLVKNYRVKVFAREENGAWPLLAEMEDGTLAGAMEKAREAVAGAEKPRPLAEFILTLWSGSLANRGPMDLSHILNPLLSPGGDVFAAKVELGPLIDKAREELSALRGGDRFWEALDKSLSSARMSLDGFPEAAAAGGSFDDAFKRYEDAATPLLKSPETPLDSQLQWLGTMAEWMAGAYEGIGLLGSDTEIYRRSIATAPRILEQKRRERREGIYTHSLHVLLILREVQEIERLAGKWKDRSETGPAMALFELKKELKGSSARWQAELAQLTNPLPPFLGRWRMLAALLSRMTPEADAAGEQGSSFFDVFYGFPEDPMAVTPDFAIPMAASSLKALPENAVEVLDAGFIDQVTGPAGRSTALNPADVRASDVASIRPPPPIVRPAPPIAPPRPPLPRPGRVDFPMMKVK